MDGLAAGLVIERESKQDRGKFEKFKEESGTIIIYSKKPLTTELEYELYENIKETKFGESRGHDLYWIEVYIKERLFIRFYFKA